MKVSSIILFEVQKHTKNINPRVSKTSNAKTMLLSKCALFDSKKSRFIKEQKTSGLSKTLAIKKPLNKIPLLGNVLF